MAIILSPFIEGLHIAYRGTKGIARGCTYLCQSAHDAFKKSDLWDKQLRPMYTYRIKPLNLRDGAVVSSCALLAGLIIQQSYLAWGKPILAVANLGGFTVFASGCTNVHLRITGIHKDFMWDRLEKLRNLIYSFSRLNKDLKSVHHKLKYILKDLQFKPIPDDIARDIDSLPGRFEKFSDMIYKPQYQVYKDQLLVLIDYLKENGGDGEKLEALRVQIENIGTKAEDLAQAKRCALAIEENPNLKIRKFLDNLQRDYDDLISALNRIDPEKTKAELLNFIENIQLRLNRHRTPGKLSKVEAPEKVGGEKPAEKPKEPVADKADDKKPKDDKADEKAFVVDEPKEPIVPMVSTPDKDKVPSKAVLDKDEGKRSIKPKDKDDISIVVEEDTDPNRIVVEITEEPETTEEKE